MSHSSNSPEKYGLNDSKMRRLQEWAELLVEDDWDILADFEEE
jgi:hypothetical protein